MLSKFFGLIKRHKIITGVIVVVLIVAIGFFARGKDEPKGDFIVLGKSDVVQEIDVTGRIEPAEKVELTPESSGKVNAVNVKVGDKVLAGDVLVQVDDTDLRIRLQKQQLSLRRAELALEEVTKGPKDSESLESENNLERAHEERFNAEEDLKVTLDAGYNAVSDSFLDMPDVITGLRDILGHSYLSDQTLKSKYGSIAQQYRRDAYAKYYEAQDAYDKAFEEYRVSNRQSDPTKIKELILDSYEATKLLSDTIKVARNLLDYVERREDSQIKPQLLAGDQTALEELTRTMNDHVVALLEIKNKITTSEQAISNANRTIGERDASNRDLNEVDSFDLEGAKIDVEQARLDVADIVAEIEKRSIKSPMDGIVTEVTAKRGQTISPGSIAVSVISVTDFQVTANLPEIDVAKVKAGLEADVSLDAYGSEVNFPMIVTSISPAESLVEGVAVYEMVLQFVKADPRIKSGLTADITVKGEQRDDVLNVPQRAVITKSGSGKFVQVLEGENIVDKPVTTGLRGSDGNIEITSGLTEGMQVLVFAESK